MPRFLRGINFQQKGNEEMFIKDVDNYLKSKTILYNARELLISAILSRISFGKTAMHLKSRILRQMRGTDALEYLCVFQAAVTMQMPKIRLSQAYVFLCGGSL